MHEEASAKLQHYAQMAAGIQIYAQILEMQM